jgi:hypothetical protein
MAYLNLAAGVSFAIVENRALFLDLSRDRYFALEREAEQAFTRLLKDPAACDAQSSDGRSLLRTGLFQEVAQAATFDPPIVCTAEGELPSNIAKHVGAVSIIEAAFLTLRARRAVRRQPLSKIIRHVESGALRAVGENGDERIRGLTAQFRAARAWVPAKRSCLQDSLALTEWLGRRRAPAQLVLGVKLNPFAAHCRNGEALADPLAPGEIEDTAVLRTERDHLGKARPGETDARDVARPVNRVGNPKRLLVEPFRPAERIIVDPDGRVASSDVDVMREREIAKAEVARDFRQRERKRIFVAEPANIPDKGVYTIEHPPVASLPGTVFQVTSVPRRPFSRARACRSSIRHA